MELVLKKDIPSLAIPVPIKEQRLPAIFKVFQNMQILCQKHNGFGLSAVQVGIPWQLFIISKRNNQWRYLLNCDYKKLSSRSIKVFEGCLSLPDQIYRVERPVDYQLQGLELIIENNELKLTPVDQEFHYDPRSDYLDHVVILHEIDHQKNILISDIGDGPYSIKQLSTKN